MHSRFLTYIIIMIFTLTFGLVTFTSASNDDNVLKNENIKKCSQISNLIVQKKDYLQKSIELRKQKMSDIEASLKNFENNNPIDSKTKKEIEDFIEESDVLILEREDLVIKLEKLLSLNCENDKKNYLVKLNIFNNNFKNHLRKELKLIENFEEKIYLKFKESSNE